MEMPLRLRQWHRVNRWTDRTKGVDLMSSSSCASNKLGRNLDIGIRPITRHLPDRVVISVGVIADCACRLSSSGGLILLAKDQF
jgi:hypothetical protein